MQSGIKPTEKVGLTATPVPTMEEAAVLTAAECAEFIDTLEVGQAQINAEIFMEYESDAFEAWLFDTYHGDSTEP
jgi:hypothetical protein